jgi:hypothetical protein
VPSTDITSISTPQSFFAASENRTWRKSYTGAANHALSVDGLEPGECRCRVLSRASPNSQDPGSGSEPGTLRGRGVERGSRAAAREEDLCLCALKSPRKATMSTISSPMSFGSELGRTHHRMTCPYGFYMRRADNPPRIIMRLCAQSADFQSAFMAIALRTASHPKP